MSRYKIACYVGGLLGLSLLIGLVVRADLPAMLHTLAAAGIHLLWLVPYRAVYFLLYAIGWLCLLRAYDPRGRAGLGYLFWVTSVREAIDRLLPVASVGGGVAGVRLVRWRGLAAAGVSATVIVEVVLTLIVSYAFTAVGLVLLSQLGAPGGNFRRLLLAFFITLPAPILTLLLLRHGSVFKRLHQFIGPLIGANALQEGAASLDKEIRASLSRWRTLAVAGSLQFAALASGSLEIWFTMRLFGHPVDLSTALILESMTQAMRHLAFVVPAGLGVQEVTLVLFGHALGVSGELALAVSMAKRLREVLCGLPALLSWQLMEGRRLHKSARGA